MVQALDYSVLIAKQLKKGLNHPQTFVDFTPSPKNASNTAVLITPSFSTLWAKMWKSNRLIIPQPFSPPDCRALEQTQTKRGAYLTICGSGIRLEAYFTASLDRIIITRTREGASYCSTGVLITVGEFSPFLTLLESVRVLNIWGVLEHFLECRITFHLFEVFCTQETSLKDVIIQP